MLQMSGSDWEENGKISLFLLLLFIYLLFTFDHRHKRKMIYKTNT